MSWSSPRGKSTHPREPCCPNSQPETTHLQDDNQVRQGYVQSTAIRTGTRSPICGILVVRAAQATRRKGAGEGEELGKGFDNRISDIARGRMVIVELVSDLSSGFGARMSNV